jgi:hypothetical protein
MYGTRSMIEPFVRVDRIERTPKNPKRLRKNASISHYQLNRQKVTTFSNLV